MAHTAHCQLQQLLLLLGCLALGRVRGDAAAAIAIVDAGSSSSKISVMAAVGDGQLNQTQPVVVIVPGLSDFAGGRRSACIKVKGAGPCLVVNGTALDYYAVIRSFASTPQIALLGTAGMRSLDSAQALALYQSFLDWAAPLYTGGATARTLAGYEEALYGWITANAFATLGEPGLLPPPSATQTVLDLGGVSAQITYATGDAANANVTRVNLPSGAADLFLQSYFGFGLDSALLTFLDGVIAPGATNITSPCLPSGTTNLTAVVAAGLFKSAVVELLQQRGIVTLVGTADFAACLAVHSPLLFTSGTRPYALIDEEGNQAPAWDAARPAALNDTGAVIAVGAYVNVLATETALPIGTPFPLPIGSSILPAMAAACSPLLLDWPYVYSLPTAAQRQGAVRRCMDLAHIRGLWGPDGFALPDTTGVVLQPSATWGPGAASFFLVVAAPPTTVVTVGTQTQDLLVANTVLLPITLVAALIALALLGVLLNRKVADGAAARWSQSEKMKILGRV